jgi:hypothetical protein
MNKKEQLIFKYEDKILDLIDNRDEFTRSDLQSCVTALVMQLINESEEI